MSRTKTHPSLEKQAANARHGVSHAEAMLSMLLAIPPMALAVALMTINMGNLLTLLVQTALLPSAAARTVEILFDLLAGCTLCLLSLMLTRAIALHVTTHQGFWHEYSAVGTHPAYSAGCMAIFSVMGWLQSRVHVVWPLSLIWTLLLLLMLVGQVIFVRAVRHSICSRNPMTTSPLVHVWKTFSPAWLVP